MTSGKVSRRWVIGVLGAGALLGAGRSGSSVESGASRAGDLHRGERLARWIIADIEPLHRGAVSVVLHSVDDVHQRFRLEILARDPSPLAARPPAETQHFAVFVCNGGDGAAPTVEEQGLAAMTLAARIARAEEAFDADGFLTHAERLAHHSDSMVQSA